MFLWLVFGYIGLLPLVVFVLLCGDRPYFEGTWLKKVHEFLIEGGCLDYVQAAMRYCCGEKGSNACASVESYCCEQSNPILQLFYLTIIGGSYFSISSTSLKYIPGHYLGAWHKYAGQASVLYGIVLFLLTSFCDSGTITAANLDRHSSVFPHCIIYEKKQCTTCKTDRPARSKHCSICNRCVARFDHHCGWMNNCIGENNLRYFLAFLIWHVLLCWYGVYLLAAIMLGEVHDQNVIRAIHYYHGTSKREVYPHVIQWLFTFYSTQVLMLIFLAIVSCLLISFAGYHVYLVVMNTTTNETYKWDHYKRWLAEVEWAKILDEDKRKSENEDPEVAIKPQQKNGFLRFFYRQDWTLPQKPKPSSFATDNIYNRGLVSNLAEVIFPLSQRTGASRKKRE